MKKAVALMFLVFICPSAGRGESAEQWYIGPRVGLISPFTGVLGIEAQRRRIALCAGEPGTFGAKYYFKFPGHSWYAGVYMVKYNYKPEKVEYEDGYPYDKERIRRKGVGGGFRWRWKGGWDLDLSLGVGKIDDVYEFRGADALYWEGTDLRGGLTFGYSF